MPLPLSTHPSVRDAPPLPFCISCVSSPLTLTIFCNKAATCIICHITMRHLSHLISTKTAPFTARVNMEAAATVALPNKCMQLEDITVVLTVLPTVRGVHSNVDAMSPALPAILPMAGMAASTILLTVRGTHGDVDATAPAPPAVSLTASMAGTGLPFPGEVEMGRSNPGTCRSKITMLGKATSEPPFLPLTDAMTVHADASIISPATLQPTLEHSSEAQGASHKCKVGKGQEGLCPLFVHTTSATISGLTQDGPSITTTGDGRDPAQCSITRAVPSITMPDARVSAEMLVCMQMTCSPSAPLLMSSSMTPSTGLDPLLLPMRMLTISNGNIICYIERDVSDPPAISYAVDIDQLDHE
ncbi:hypothetical protein EW146_g7366 [Bondarzewia mesenterica]|uniref:Uncharacterized protein n=1 Tax=Bondarzewia mesenterica TaxID=1095465 RepID=A0A4S4LMT5_9AGAM|nr:hypothetical protein EW146_g7366 [Bondarzewia mesenterica]